MRSDDSHVCDFSADRKAIALYSSKKEKKEINDADDEICIESERSAKGRL